MSSYEEALRVTCELLRHHVDESRPIRPTDHIQNDLGLDSLSVWELASDVESRFGVNIPTDIFAQVATVEDMARLVHSLRPDDASAGAAR
ncbi:MAG TPA: acyl carrier protein [Polyangiaceae bacterium]|nr:acyl carrier protein [Polyangiaceae bacterium]